MTEILVPFAFTLFVWWFSTGAILYLDGLPKRTFPWTMLGATLVLVAGLYGLAASRHDATVAGAYTAFTSALLVWAWQEVGFLLGFVTGPRRAPCPAGCVGGTRLGYAIQAIFYHELALVMLAIAVVWLTAGGANPVGLWTFAVLLTMRQSAKINLFLGVRNLGENLLPDHLRYIESYFGRRSMNVLFPFSVAAASIAAFFLWRLVFAAPPGAFAVSAYTLVATLLTLAIVEHLFMVLPLPAEILWRWSLRSRQAASDARCLAGDSRECRSWSAPLPGRCDPNGLRDVLDAGARGAFGDLDRISGVARARSGWIHFEMACGRSSLSACAPREREEARVFAIGRAVDEARLQAAFDACASPL